MKLPVKPLVVGAVLCLAATASTWADEIRITYKSAKSASSYYQMGVQIAQAMKIGSNGEVIVTVEESQGSVQNVMEVKARGADYVFTSPPVLVKLAQEGKAMFADKGDGKFDDIRALFPIPSLTMQFVISKEAAVLKFSQLEGKKLLLGKGSFGAREGAKYIKLFGLEGKVTIVDSELSNAVSALKNGQIDGFVTAGSWPAPNVVEAAASTSVNLISMDGEEVKKTKRTRMVIPAGTYTGQEDDVVTTSLPVIVYTTTQMDDDTAYLLTKTFWAQRNELIQAAAWWKGVDDQLMVNITGKLHPGAIKFYKEAGIPIAKNQQ
ncbi:MAG: TAXI family TRAP transporter solute-binding subunit [Hyphomicrobiales bacterium]|nr:TAXI family TRAP transporter solute-binding subunit [Hyphomicrobiales bacterium]MCP5001961.1 TAXI family TRAP transporter solute-binding subunit [Hyphomicrobiales bacterium]